MNKPLPKAIHAQDNAQLQYIDGQAFLGVPSLALLNVSNSSLFTLQEELAVNLAAHREAHGKLAIDLAENPVLCDCNVRYMYQVSFFRCKNGRIAHLTFA